MRGMLGNWAEKKKKVECSSLCITGVKMLCFLFPGKEAEGRRSGATGRRLNTMNIDAQMNTWAHQPTPSPSTVLPYKL